MPWRAGRPGRRRGESGPTCVTSDTLIASKVLASLSRPQPLGISDFTSGATGSGTATVGRAVPSYRIRGVAKRKGKAARNEALEAAILADPSQPGAYLVYGDWLQQQGDPRGELVAVQHALLSARGKEFARLKIREQEILDAEPAHFFGPLAQFRKARRTALDWYCGFVSGMRGNFEKHLDAFLGHPSGLFVQS